MMIKAVCPALLLLFALNIRSQTTAVCYVSSGGEPVPGALIFFSDSSLQFETDSNGKAVLTTVPDGAHTLIISAAGYYTRKVKVQFPNTTSVLNILLEEMEEELEEVVVFTNRSRSNREQTTLRVEVVSPEETTERSLDKPSSVSNVIREQPGIQLQRSSASLGFFRPRLQGLNSRYVQIMRDGFPMYGGFAGAIGFTQIPPIDLRQVEIVRGPSSVFFGADAVAGVIHLISKEPDEGVSAADFLLNVESTRSVDVQLFLNQRLKWFGVTLAGSYRYQSANDWNKDNFSDLPKMQRYYLQPQLHFFLSQKLKLVAGGGVVSEQRTGGAMPYLKGDNDPVYQYYEQNNSLNLSGTLRAEYTINERHKLVAKGCAFFFDRKLQLPYQLFAGRQMLYQAEVSYSGVFRKHRLIVGADVKSDRFREADDSSKVKADYHFLTTGLFVQYGYHFNAATSAEAGLRTDFVNGYGVFALPQIGVRRMWNDYFTTRLNAGMGYKLPTLFDDEAERLRYIHVYPPADSVKPELAAGGTLDFSARLPSFNGVNIRLSQMIFYNHLFKPITTVISNIENCVTLECEQMKFQNINGYNASRGFETVFEIGYRGLGFKASYTYTNNITVQDNLRSFTPYTSAHQVALLAGYELFEKYSIGIDCYYWGPQRREDGSATRGFWELGINTQLRFRYLDVFANLENILDMRQTRFEKVVKPYPTLNHPRFERIYAPMEGIVFNMGVKVKLGSLIRKPTNDRD